jgi:ornithine cyclodeaminase/alanine dehydrogenase-like protein (mu-crystallin family)
MAASPTLRYLSAADVEAAMPPLPERLRLAERTMTALVADAQLPPKIGVHPESQGSFAHAMPAALRAVDGSAALLGMKWVTGFPANNQVGLPAIHGLVLLSDAATGAPRAILDARPITAQRTAAVSGVAISRFAPRVGGRSPRAALIGAGTQGHSHVPVLGHLLPDVDLRLYDRHPDRADALASLARSTDGIGRATVAQSAEEAIAAADVVVTATSLHSVCQVMTEDWLSPNALVVPIDYATYCHAEVARNAALFLVDDRRQFVAIRAEGEFEDYPDPTSTLGEAILERTGRPEHGRVVVSHLGVGLADVIFGDAIVSAAERAGIGTLLPG